jgi:hypothetical protein
LIGNGYLSHAKGVRSDYMYISGVFNGETTSPSHRAKIPATYAVTVDNSKTIGALLDVRQGSYHRRGYVSDTNGAWYELRWYAHREERGLYVLEVDVHNDLREAVTLQLRNAFFHGQYRSEDFQFDASFSSQGSICGHTLIPETSGGPAHTVCVAQTLVPDALSVGADQPFASFSFVSAYRTSLDVDTTASASPVDAVRAAAEGDLARAQAAAATLYATHVDGWRALWQRSNIHVEGRPDVGQAVNASLFAIFSSVRDDWAYGLAPGGLTNYYNGHAFWDTETWMYPALLLLQPALAHALLQYRFDRLAGARQKAQSYSPPFGGAMFPWESAFSGVETCPSWAATGQREDHISGDIALAVWQYYLVTRDATWLRAVGYPVLSDVADFWTSRATYVDDAATGQRAAHIFDIIPPDEYVDHVDDSVYSNAVASLALSFFVQAHRLLYPAASAASAASTAAEDARVAACEQLARDLVILFDPALQIHPEYAAYSGAVVKQADVVLLHYPLGVAMNATVQRADLDYYAARTDPHGPAMTWGMQSIGYLDLGAAALAAQFFNRSFQDNTHAPFGVWTETPDGNAVNFITGAGGFLQTVVHGYLGLRVVHRSHFDDDEGDEGDASSAAAAVRAWRRAVPAAQVLLRFTPKCIEGVTRLAVRGVHVLQTPYDVSYRCSAAAEASDVQVTLGAAAAVSSPSPSPSSVVVVEDVASGTFFFVLLPAAASPSVALPAQYRLVQRW